MSKRYWTLNADNEPAGPFEIGQLRQMAAEGTLKPDSLVCPEGQDEWIAWSSILPHLSQTTETPSPIHSLLRWKGVLIAGILGLVAGWAASTVLPLSMILHGGRYFRVYQAAERPPHAWYGHLKNAWTGQSTEIIADFGKRLDLASDDRIQATFVPTEETGIWNNGPRRIYKVEGSHSFLPPD